jgi:hypothetical protein
VSVAEIAESARAFAAVPLLTGKHQQRRSKTSDIASLSASSTCGETPAVLSLRKKGIDVIAAVANRGLAAAYGQDDLSSAPAKKLDFRISK